MVGNNLGALRAEYRWESRQEVMEPATTYDLSRYKIANSSQMFRNLGARCERFLYTFIKIAEI